MGLRVFFVVLLTVTNLGAQEPVEPYNSLAHRALEAAEQALNQGDYTSAQEALDRAQVFDPHNLDHLALSFLLDHAGYDGDDPRALLRSSAPQGAQLLKRLQNESTTVVARDHLVQTIVEILVAAGRYSQVSDWVGSQYERRQLLTLPWLSSHYALALYAQSPTQGRAFARDLLNTWPDEPVVIAMASALLYPHTPALGAKSRDLLTSGHSFALRLLDWTHSLGTVVQYQNALKEWGQNLVAQEELEPKAISHSLRYALEWDSRLLGQLLDSGDVTNLSLDLFSAMVDQLPGDLIASISSNLKSLWVDSDGDDYYDLQLSMDGGQIPAGFIWDRNLDGLPSLMGQDLYSLERTPVLMARFNNGTIHFNVTEAFADYTVEYQADSTRTIEYYANENNFGVTLPNSDRWLHGDPMEIRSWLSSWYDHITSLPQVPPYQRIIRSDEGVEEQRLYRGNVLSTRWDRDSDGFFELIEGYGAGNSFAQFELDPRTQEPLYFIYYVNGQQRRFIQSEDQIYEQPLYRETIDVWR